MHLSDPKTVTMASSIRAATAIKPLALTSEARRPSVANMDQPISPQTTRKSSITPIPLTHAPSSQRRSPSISSNASDSADLSRSSSMSSAPVAAASADELFSSSLISQDVTKPLPEGYTIRPLSRNDHKGGMLEVLKVLTTVGDISEEAWLERFDYFKKREGDYFLIVVEDEGKKIVGTGAVIVERKFIHNLGMVGHIEDIAVAKDQQGKKLGLRIIETLDYIAKTVGCYKTILDCSEANEGFYVKCGYKKAGLEMAHYY